MPFTFAKAQIQKDNAYPNLTFALNLLKTDIIKINFSVVNALNRKLNQKYSFWLAIHDETPIVRATYGTFYDVARTEIINRLRNLMIRSYRVEKLFIEHYSLSDRADVSVNQILTVDPATNTIALKTDAERQTAYAATIRVAQGQTLSKGFFRIVPSTVATGIPNVYESQLILQQKLTFAGYDLGTLDRPAGYVGNNLAYQFSLYYDGFEGRDHKKLRIIGHTFPADTLGIPDENPVLESFANMFLDGVPLEAGNAPRFHFYTTHKGRFYNIRSATADGVINIRRINRAEPGAAAGAA